MAGKSEKYEASIKPPRKVVNKIKKLMGLSHQIHDDVLSKEAYKQFGVDIDGKELWEFLTNLLEKECI